MTRFATRLLLALALPAGLLPASAAAQTWALHGAWVAGRIGAAGVTAEVRRPLGAPPPLPVGRPAGTGAVEAPTRRWLLTGAVGAGLDAIADGASVDPLIGGGATAIEPVAWGRLGLLRRTGRAVPSRVGAVLAAYLPAAALGPALELDAADVARLELGVLRDDGAWRALVALGVSLRFLADVVGG